MPIRDPEKNRAAQRQWYRKHKGAQAHKTKRNRQRIQTALNNYKANKGCLCCGESDPVVLVFHHRVPAEKEFTIANAARSGRSLKFLLLEADKCDVLCANCHLRTHNRPR